MESFREFQTWQEAMTLAEMVYKVTEQMPKEEAYGMRRQARNASTSIPANIAEGYGRHHRGEYLQFLGIASGSLTELETLLELSVRLSLIKSADDELAQCASVGRLLYRLRQSLRA